MAIIKFSSFLLLPLMVFALILMPIISGQTCRLFDSTSIPEERWESASKCNASCKSLGMKEGYCRQFDGFDFCCCKHSHESLNSPISSPPDN
ncbi:hypothetical protein ISN44_As12g033760 [Arabidopsis suecica]|uniref:Uncharacterized protein n=1 Tax=Arabidopsis suecica TaxID=45249 RepID=A0A8T1YPJ0_ARASU|nr:hypothetical protein ISN44_As12g033760 [Arabidopsis suecica]